MEAELLYSLKVSWNRRILKLLKVRGGQTGAIVGQIPSKRARSFLSVSSEFEYWVGNGKSCNSPCATFDWLEAYGYRKFHDSS
jgi:hypothetical protein